MIMSSKKWILVLALFCLFFANPVAYYLKYSIPYIGKFSRYKIFEDGCLLQINF